MTFNFPPTNFVEINGIAAQADHIYSEALEVKQSVLVPDIKHTAEEIMDCLHSCETALRILVLKYGVSLEEIRLRVEQKNKRRSYYHETELI